MTRRSIRIPDEQWQRWKKAAKQAAARTQGTYTLSHWIRDACNARAAAGEVREEMERGEA